MGEGTGSTLVGEIYIPSPGSPAEEAGAKKSSRPFKWHKTGNYARQTAKRLMNISHIFSFAPFCGFGC